MSKEQLSIYLKKPLQELVTPQAKQYALTLLFKEMLPYTPYVTGNMATNVNITENGIEYIAEYAHRQYTGDDFNFTKDQHPLAQARWGQVAIDLHGDRIAKQIKDYILR